jgi:hypothetical protein
VRFRLFVGGVLDTVDMPENVKPEETYAARFLESWTSKYDEVRTLGNGNTPDIQITYSNGAIAYCEVKRDANADEEALSSRLRKHGDLKLKAGCGSWVVTLSKSVDFYTFNPKLQVVVDDLIAVGIHDWDPRNTVLKFNSQDYLLQIGVDSMRQIKDSTEDRLIIFKSADFGVVIDDANTVIPWLESVQYRSKYVSPIERLAINGSTEQHLFVLIDSNTPQEIALISQFHPTELPSEKLHLSPKLTHLWAAPFFNFNYERDCAWVFTNQKGWELVEIER